VLAGLLARSSDANAPSTGWKPIGVGGTERPVGQIGLARLGGTLHVAWIRRTGGNAYDLMHTSISPSGRIAAPNVVVRGWYQLNQAALIAVRNRPASNVDLTAYFQGAKSVTPNEPYTGVVRANSGNQGSSWTLPESSALFTGNGTGAGLSAAEMVGEDTLLTWHELDGQVVAWAPPFDATLVHYGQSACCATNENVAGNGDDFTTAAAWLAWCQQNDAPSGLWVQKLDIRSDNGDRPPRLVGGATVLSGSQHVLCESQGRVPLVVRPADMSFFVAGLGSPSGRRVLLWRLGKAAPLLVAGGVDAKSRVALAAAPDGRLWVAWRTFHDASTLHLRRSNRAGTVLGAQVDVKAPAGAVEIWHTDLDAQADRVDAVTTFTFVSAIKGNPYHTQVFPGLTLKATGGKIAHFKVTDAGDPVAGATIKVGGKTLHTAADGTASADLPIGSFTATASKVHYVSARDSVQSV